uniref:CWF19-like protein 1 n=1 Tax=Ciona savignyi TaxID=51511 RepID=H2Y9K2_CIOSA
LVCGDVRGKFDQVFGRVRKLQSKGNDFSMLLCVGDFFSDSVEAKSSWLEYLNGTKKCPITTFILGPNNENVESYFADSADCGGELCENITYLGAVATGPICNVCLKYLTTIPGDKGIFTGTSGLKIAYLSGVESNDPTNTSFNVDDIKVLSSQLGSDNADYKGIDILMTSSWPKGIHTYGNSPYLLTQLSMEFSSIPTIPSSHLLHNKSNEKCKSCGSELLAQLAKTCKPRYHFAGMEGINYERLPYRNHTVLAEPSRHVTRFIALGHAANSEKQKYLYAFLMTPMPQAEDLNTQPPDTTQSPYDVDKANKIPVLISNNSATADVSVEYHLCFQLSCAHYLPTQYRWNMDMNRGQKRKSQNNNHNQPERKHSRPRESADWSCWFCLGGEKVEKHLVASVGDLVNVLNVNIYITLCCYVAMAKGGLSPDHVLILPIAHHSSSNDLPEDTMLEVTRYKDALRSAFKHQERDCVFFERNYRTDHMQIQVVPLPKGVTSDTVKKSFIELAATNADRHGNPSPLDFAQLPARTDLKQVLGKGIPFFHVELPDGTRLLHRIQRFFPLQFGREALCSAPLLNAPNRVDWRSCDIPRDQESEHTKKFREFFKKFDVTMAD